MNKTQLKQLIRECLQEEKYGDTSYRVVMTKDYDGGMGSVYKKGQSVSVDGVSDDGKYAWIRAGHGLTIDIPLTHAKLITTQGRLPVELSQRIQKVFRSLNALVRDKERYYSDVFTDNDAKKIADRLKVIADELVNTKSPVRKD